ncbi:RNA polymerase sigma factor [Streptomyces broussonetiae]|uniref:RNA polymerase sigma factor n=1 Tax=Streptomyces broussonetiae TaxID=2686304 RepID=UPI001E6069AE|nr:sigma-70 family RNA polymerase sigma factor [Streptomyces broussonetiae]
MLQDVSKTIRTCGAQVDHRRTPPEEAVVTLPGCGASTLLEVAAALPELPKAGTKFFELSRCTFTGGGHVGAEAARGSHGHRREDEFTDVHRAHYEDVLRFVRRRAHPMNVDDIVGETFLAAWCRRSELPKDPRPWLFGTARNALLNAHRGQRRQTAVAVRVPENGGDESYDGVTQAEERMDLVAAWRRLSAADQEVLALHDRNRRLHLPERLRSRHRRPHRPHQASSRL